jgi:signal transduction histidine kinase
VALSAVALAVLLLGVPLAVAIERNAVSEERGELERAALQAAVVVSPTYRTGDPVELPPTEEAVLVGLYTVAGNRVAGSGPDSIEAEVAAAASGRVVDGSTDRELVEAVPVSVDERVIGIVRSSSSRSEVNAIVAHDLLLLGGLALLAVIGAGSLAFWQARRLTTPMEALADAATQLGAGDFSVRTPVTGVPEIDSTGEALTITAGRLAAQLERERAFAAQASHQLRTPMTRLRLELEGGLTANADPASAVHDALVTADLLEQTIDDVLAVARGPHESAPEFDVEALLSECADQWRGLFASRDRPLRVVVDDGPPRAAASLVAVRQVLQVLIDNAYRHGTGRVTLTARESGGAVAIDVADRGSSTVVWPDSEAQPGRLGLAMARSLAASQNGRLLLASDSSGTTFTLLVPAAPDRA